MARGLAAVFCILFLATAGFAVRCLRSSSEWERKHNALQGRLDELTVQANAELSKASHARATAEREVRRAVEEAEARVKTAADLIRDNELYKVHPDLQLLRGQTISLGKAPVASFTVEESAASDGYPSKRVVITYQNNGSESIKPTVTIYFLNQYGLVTGYARDSWSFSSIGPGERRIETAFARLEHGPAVYWRIDIKQ